MWIISVPVWGERYCSVFEQYAAPALMAALKDFQEPVRFVIHTLEPQRIAAALPGFEVKTKGIESRPSYVTLQRSHADAIAEAKVGDKVVLLNADIVVSVNLFSQCLYHFERGKQAVVTSGVRTPIDPKQPPPIGAQPSELLKWAWEHRHQIIRDLEWGAGTSMLPTNLFFSGANSVVLHGFHLHPVAIVKERELSFVSTIDGDLLDHFDRDRIHVVMLPDDLAMLEMSPADRRFPLRNVTLRPATVAASMMTRASPLHRWLFRHKIVLIGSGNDCDTGTVVAEIIGIMERNKR